MLSLSWHRELVFDVNKIIFGFPGLPWSPFLEQMALLMELQNEKHQRNFRNTQDQIHLIWVSPSGSLKDFDMIFMWQDDTVFTLRWPVLLKTDRLNWHFEVWTVAKIDAFDL